MNTKNTVLTCLFGCAFSLRPSLQAEEGGTGHYLPGSIASFVDGTPAAPTFVTRFNGIYYDGIGVGFEWLKFGIEGT
jgi:hypothetical protein